MFFFFPFLHIMTEKSSLDTTQGGRDYFLKITVKNKQFTAVLHYSWI